MLAAAAAASQPACPAPTTTTSYFLNIYTSMFHVEHIMLFIFTVPRGTVVYYSDNSNQRMVFSSNILSS